MNRRDVHILMMAACAGLAEGVHAQCGTTVYDTGGPGGNYGLNQNLTWTYCAPPGQILTITFTTFNTEGFWDELSVHAGPTNGSPQLGIFSGAALPPSFASTPGGCLTLWFTSDGSITYPGWSINITCAPAPPPPAGDCVYQLQMFDSFGDGWDGSTVGISINGGPFTTYTIGGAYGSALIGLDIGDQLVVQYTAAGIWQNEISYTIGFMGGATVFTSGSPPATGFVFTQVIDCNPPPAAPEDCVGAITICNGQSFNNNTQNTGSVADLNPANYGCLLSSEMQGTWYTFSPSTGGNVAFTINPTAPLTDYDFAIWGPFPPGSTTATICPPPGTPLRCSYSALYGNTGLNYTAPDNSEDALGDKWVNDLAVTTGQVYLLYVSNWSQNGLAFDLTWNLTNGASLDCTVLPIELLVFEADAVDDHVMLHWATASESMSDHFVVERSTTGTDFAPIGTMAAAGNSIERKDYFFMDPGPHQGINHYRLVQVDVDGTPDLSAAVSALYHPHGAYVGDPHPVPTESDVAIDLGGALSGRVHIVARDVSGRILHEEWLMMERNSFRTVVIPSSIWPAGLYLLDVRHEDGRQLKQTRWVKR